jgi:uncharacterized protein (TIGR00369 family)
MSVAGVTESLDFVHRVKQSFAEARRHGTIGAQLTLVEPGVVDICLDWAPGLTQQHGFLHAGMVPLHSTRPAAAGLTLMPADAAVLTIEFKINLLAPAKGQRFRMEGRVIKPGRTITVSEGKAFAIDQGKRN